MKQENVYHRGVCALNGLAIKYVYLKSSVLQYG